MKTVPAAEVKRRGVVALEESLADGPVYIIKNNRPACVVLSEPAYEELRRSATGQAAKPRETAMQFLLHGPAAKCRTRKEIDAQLREERDSWER